MFNYYFNRSIFTRISLFDVCASLTLYCVCDHLWLVVSRTLEADNATFSGHVSRTLQLKKFFYQTTFYSIIIQHCISMGSTSFVY